MELPPDPNRDMGFFSDGVNKLYGKRKSDLLETQSVKASRLESEATRVGFGRMSDTASTALNLVMRDWWTTETETGGRSDAGQYPMRRDGSVWRSREFSNEFPIGRGRDLQPDNYGNWRPPPLSVDPPTHHPWTSPAPRGDYEQQRQAWERRYAAIGGSTWRGGEWHSPDEANRLDHIANMGWFYYGS